jgi:ubiquitin-activating enzyme E1
MDRIEVSNLSRQFLFRQEHVGQPKSICGAKVVSGWNPALNIESLEMFVGGKTENFFDDEFWEGLDLCWNALDNVKARQYTDSRCLFYSKPLLESGTLGTKCNGEIILPFRTKSYNDIKETDDNENQIAMCTLKNFPYLPLHCIEYARQSYFTDYFEDEPQKYEQFRTDMDAFLETINNEGSSTRLKILKRLQRLCEAQEGGVKFEDCITLAFDQMMFDYRIEGKSLGY